MSLAQKLAAVVRAEESVIAALEKLYPVDSEVRCWLMYGQVNPSRGRVIGHEGGRYGYVTVRLESRTQEVRRVAAESIL